MERPKEIWWCRYIDEDGDMYIKDLVRNPEQDTCITCNNVCKMDHKPCDAVKGTITWKQSSPHK